MGGTDGAPKELRRLLVAAEKAGVAVTLTRGGHYQLRGNGWTLHVSQTPRNLGMCCKSLRGDLKKRGITV